jgi:hypothetical protein
MEWDWKRDRSLESLLVHVIAKLSPEGLGERNASGVFEVMQDSPHWIGKEKQRAREVEGVVAAPATSAETFDDGSRHAALRAERPGDGFELRPAIGTGCSPFALEDSRIAEDTRLRKKKIQDRVDHGDLSSTQRAGSIYSGVAEKSRGELWKMPKTKIMKSQIGRSARKFHPGSSNLRFHDFGFWHFPPYFEYG